MKTIEEIRHDKRVIIQDTAVDGIRGWVTIRGKAFVFVASNGGGWDHVSVSARDRTPSWGEMCEVKDIFFREDECCVEYHPAKVDYINIHPNCLHIWRPHVAELPKPPKIYV